MQYSVGKMGGTLILQYQTAVSLISNLTLDLSVSLTVLVHAMQGLENHRDIVVFLPPFYLKKYCILA